MSKGKYTEAQIISLLRRHSGVNVSDTTITINGFVGIKTKGKIDFLRNHCGFFVTIQ